MAGHEPCGALPVEIHSLTVVLCENHRAWTVHLSCWRQTGEERTEEVLPPVSWELGPFDEPFLIERTDLLYDRLRAWLGERAWRATV